MNTSDPISRVIRQLTKIPSIGERTAERIALHLVKMPSEEITTLCQVIADLKNTHYCEVCFNPVIDNGSCRICSDTMRDHALVCIVEQAADLRALEQTGVYHGVYHVLGGHLAPLEGTEPQNLTIQALVARLKEGKIKEVILATNPTLEGDATALYLQKIMANYPVKISRIAKGIASGSTIDSSNKVILTDALKNRQLVLGNKTPLLV